MAQVSLRTGGMGMGAQALTLAQEYLFDREDWAGRAALP